MEYWMGMIRVNRRRVQIDTEFRAFWCWSCFISFDSGSRPDILAQLLRCTVYCIKIDVLINWLFVWYTFVAGVSLWYDLHGAPYAGLAACLAVLAQYPADHSQWHTERPHHWPFWPRAACLHTAHSKGHQGAKPSSAYTVTHDVLQINHMLSHYWL